MPVFFIHLTDAHCVVDDEGAHYDRPENALAVGVRGALALLSDEINRGVPNAAVDVNVKGEDGTAVLRAVVAISVSTLQP